ncbi:MAG: outer membrane protein assembly factor BamB family protein [Acidobacteriaceae bacterium]
MNRSQLSSMRRSFLSSLVGIAMIGIVAPISAVGQSPSGTSENAVSAEFPNQNFPENLPNDATAQLYPSTWTTYAANAGRNPAFQMPANAPKQFQDGVEWSFAGAGAMPLTGAPPAGNFKTAAYTVGMPVGVSVVKGIVYVGDDNGYTYAMNAETGKLIWAHYGWNMNMSNPLVVGDSVFVSTGSAYFNYANTMKYLKGKRPTRGPGLNTIYALDRTTGKEIWAYHTPGEGMPTPLYKDGFLYEGTGDGHIYKLAADTGTLVWKADITSFDSMSSLVEGSGYVFAGGTDPNYFYAVDENTGKIAWKMSIPDMVATGIGDCTPAYQAGTVVQEVTISSGDASKPVANVLLALDAKTGNILWQKRFPNGPVPPAMKTATPIIVDGVVYEGSPVSGEYYAINLKDGNELWKLQIGSQIRAGAAVQNGIAYLPYRAGDIAAIQIKDGKRVGVKHIGGAFGPSSPVIVGGTLYVSNVYGYVNAIPLTEIYRPSKAVMAQ